MKGFGGSPRLVIDIADGGPTSRVSDFVDGCRGNLEQRQQSSGGHQNQSQGCSLHRGHGCEKWKLRRDCGLWAEICVCLCICELWMNDGWRSQSLYNVFKLLGFGCGNVKINAQWLSLVSFLVMVLWLYIIRTPFWQVDCVCFIISLYQTW